MSIKRYFFGWDVMAEDENGEYVLHSDHTAAVEAAWREGARLGVEAALAATTDCDLCNGEGSIESGEDHMGLKGGGVYHERCPRCHGTGETKETRVASIVASLKPGSLLGGVGE